jgi:hypothetical protein
MCCCICEHHVQRTQNSYSEVFGVEEDQQSEEVKGDTFHRTNEVGLRLIEFWCVCYVYSTKISICMRFYCVWWRVQVWCQCDACNTHDTPQNNVNNSTGAAHNNTNKKTRAQPIITTPEMPPKLPLFSFSRPAQQQQ